MRTLRVTKTDLMAQEEFKALNSTVSTAQYAQLQLCQRFIKNIHNAILLHVNTSGKKELSKNQEECAYARMVEDFCGRVLKDHVYLMRLLPSLLHAGFVSYRTYTGVKTSLQNLVQSPD